MKLAGYYLKNMAIHILGILTGYLAMAYLAITMPVSDTKLHLFFALLAGWAGVFGPLSTAIVAFGSHLVFDLNHYEHIWYSWIICSGIIGYAYGLGIHKDDLRLGKLTRNDTIRFNVIQVVANMIVYGLFAPTMDVFMYHETASRAFIQGWVAGMVNSFVVMIFGTLILKLLASFLRLNKPQLEETIRKE